jgi:hypothetical protein
MTILQMAFTLTIFCWALRRPAEPASECACSRTSLRDR